MPYVRETHTGQSAVAHAAHTEVERIAQQPFFPVDLDVQGLLPRIHTTYPVGLDQRLRRLLTDAVDRASMLETEIEAAMTHVHEKEPAVALCYSTRSQVLAEAQRKIQILATPSAKRRLKEAERDMQEIQKSTVAIKHFMVEHEQQLIQLRRDIGRYRRLLEVMDTLGVALPEATEAAWSAEALVCS